MVMIPKPKHRMKKVIDQIEQCIYFNSCSKCWYKGEKLCQEKLVSDGLWYLRQTLEKSESGQK